MVNPYYYLFYRLSRFLNKNGNNEWGPIGAITWFTGWYLCIIYIKVFPVTIYNYQNSYKYGIIEIAIGLFITNTILFLDKKRVQEIINQYGGESERSKRIGIVFVILYITFSLALILFI